MPGIAESLGEHVGPLYMLCDGCVCVCVSSL